MAIKFYRTKEPYGCFANFSRHAIELDGFHWPTTEHYFQAQKFVGTEYYDKVRLAETPRVAADLGRNRSFPLRKDWEQVKDDVMRKAVLKKVETYKDIMLMLLNTGDEEIIEDSPVDYYWGCGSEGTGKNMLGKILMEIREKMKSNKNITDNPRSPLFNPVASLQKSSVYYYE
jgi:ribA/ribD-fused uncharacterized protein